MRVLKLNDQAAFEKVITKRGNNLIIPVNDGNGDLIISTQVLKDPVYADIAKTIQSLTTEVEYVPFPEDERAFELKIQELETAKKLVKFNSTTEEVRVGLKTLNIKTGEIKEDGIVETIKSGVKTIARMVGIIPNEVTNTKAEVANKLPWYRRFVNWLLGMFR